MLIHKCVLPAGATFGPLTSEFDFPIQDGYTVLVGENDSGKSSILQFIARTCFNNAAFGTDATGFIPTERDYVDGTMETQGSNLNAWNAQLYGTLNSQGRPLSYANAEINVNVLPKLYITHHDLMEQAARLNELWAELDFPKLQIAGQQRLKFRDIEAIFHGSGLRSVFAILAALTDPLLKIILIDEPERSLEAKLQKRLRDLLIRESDKRPIVVSTHSHLFLNRQEPQRNVMVSNSAGRIELNTVQSDEKLIDIAFTMLGNSTQDLFFPANFLVVEGAFDQAICEKVGMLLGIHSREIKVLSSAGIDNAESLVRAVENNLTSLVAAYSPYKERTCALIDGANENNRARVDEIVRVLKDRCFVLPVDCMEKYIPDAVYAKADLNRDEIVREFESLRPQPKKREMRKREVSQKLADFTSKDDLRELGVIVKALQKAKALAS